MWLIVGIYGAFSGFLAAQLWKTAHLQSTVDLQQGAPFGVHTQLTLQSLRNWNIGNFRTYHFTYTLAILLGVSSVIFAWLTHVSRETLLLPFSGLAILWMILVFIYFLRKQMANRAIREYVDEL